MYETIAVPYYHLQYVEVSKFHLRVIYRDGYVKNNWSKPVGMVVFGTHTYRLLQLLCTVRFFHAFSSFVRQMPGYNWQRRGTARTPPK